MTTIVIGIDVGLTGAIAKVSADSYEVEDIPTAMKGDGSGVVANEVNAAGVAEILRRMTEGHRDDAMVVIERLTGRPNIVNGVKMPSQSSRVFSNGDSYGVLRAVALVLGLRVEYVTAAAWKGHYKLPGGPKQKELARARAITYYPRAPLARVKDHNRAESLLLARYGWETLR